MPFEFKDNQDIAEKKFKRFLRNAFIIVGAAGFTMGFMLGLVI